MIQERPLTPKEVILKDLNRTRQLYQNNVNLFIARRNEATDAEYEQSLQRDIDYGYQMISVYDQAIYLIKTYLSV